MGEPVGICTFELDVILADKAGKRLPNPMINVAVDRQAQLIIGVWISTEKPRSSNSTAEL